MKKQVQIISGAEGGIEIRSQVASGDTKRLVVICHPHPLYGGTMNNKVVTTIEKAFFNLDFNTVTFNFRGVGSSSGEYDNGVGEQEDLLSVLDWAVGQFKPEYIVLAGFSFGSYVVLKAQDKLVNVNALCTVAPPVGLYDFSNIKGIEKSWTLIQGGKDEVISAREVMDWSMSHEKQPDIYWRAQASHFFHGELIWLKNLIQGIY